MNAIAEFFSSTGFMPHGYCFRWSPGLLWTYVASDAMIGLSYYAISIALWAFVRRRTDLPFGWLFLMFAVFIVACGTTHLIAILDIWDPRYWLDAAVKTITALVSLAAAIVIWPLIPKALALPSPMQLQQTNEALTLEVATRRRVESQLQLLNRELEVRVARRTAELETAADALRRRSEQLETAVQSLRASEARFRATFDQAAVGIAHVAPDGRWLRMNQKLCDIVGYTRDELLSMTFQDITHPDDLYADLTQVQQILEGKIDSYTMEKRYLRKDGHVIWAALTVALVRDDDAHPEYFISVVVDISARKAAEEALRVSREELRRLTMHIQQLGEEEKARVARELHDDFAQRLSALKIAVEMAEQKDAAREDGPAASPELKAMAALIDQLIGAIRHIAGELRPSMLDDLGLAAAIDWLANEFTARHQVRVIRHIDSDAIAFNRDSRIEVYRIVQEALANVAQHAEATEVIIDIARDEPNCVVRIADNGRGAASHAAQSRDTFGLLGMRERAALLGGHVKFRTSPGQGFAVIATLPLATIEANERG